MATDNCCIFFRTLATSFIEDLPGLEPHLEKTGCWNTESCGCSLIQLTWDFGSAPSDALMLRPKAFWIQKRSNPASLASPVKQALRPAVYLEALMSESFPMFLNQSVGFNTFQHDEHASTCFPHEQFHMLEPLTVRLITMACAAQKPIASGSSNTSWHACCQSPAWADLSNSYRPPSQMPAGFSLSILKGYCPSNPAATALLPTRWRLWPWWADVARRDKDSDHWRLELKLLAAALNLIHFAAQENGSF